MSARAAARRQKVFRFRIPGFEKLEPDYGIGEPEAEPHSGAEPPPVKPYVLQALPTRRPSFKLDLDEAKRFLAALDPEATAYTWQTYTDEKGKVKPGQLDPLAHNQIKSVDLFAPVAARYQERGAGIYVQVNLGARRNANVRGVRALFVDDDVAGRVHDLSKCPPSIVNESSPGKRQIFWLLTDEERDNFDGWKQGQRHLIAAFGTDPKMVNLDRVLRLPGSLHLKNPAKPHRVRILELHPERRYTIDEVIAAFPATVPAKPKKRGALRLGDRGEVVELAEQLKMLDGRVKNLDDGGVAYHGKCPNADKHSDGNEECLYYPADAEKGQTYGWVHCFHSHCEKLGARRMLELLKAKAPRLMTWPERWLAKRMARMRVTYEPRTDTLLVDGNATKMEAFLNALHLDAADESIKLQLADAALGMWLDTQREQVREQLRMQMGYAPDETGQLRKYVQAVTGGEDEVVMAVVEHFMWQVKRKLHGLPVTRHLMPILVGKQNGGKSTAVTKLIEPIAAAGLVEYCRDLKLIEDDRHIARYATKLVVLCDEMAHATRTDVASLKNFITGDVASWRIMKTTISERTSTMSTFIGTSNPDVVDILRDDTGMRRFFEVRALDVLDWAVIDAIDYVKVWQAVDHRVDSSPIEAVWERVAQRQQTITAKNSVEEWLSLHCDCSDSVREWVGSRDAYNVYASWMHTQRRTPESETSFGRKMGAAKVGWKHAVTGSRWRLRILDADTPLNIEIDPPQRRPTA